MSDKNTTPAFPVSPELHLHTVRRLSILADRCLYLQEKEERIREKLTLCEHSFSILSGSGFTGRDRIFAACADASAALAEERKHLLLCRKKLILLIQKAPQLSEAEKQAVLYRLSPRSTITQIAAACRVSPPAVIQRIRRSGKKLTGEDAGAEEFYNCLTRLREASGEEKA